MTEQHEGQRRPTAGAAGPQPPEPLVLIADADPEETLRHALAAGWSGPVILVSSEQEAAELRASAAAWLPHGEVSPERWVLALDQVSRCARFAGTEMVLSGLEADLLASLLCRPDMLVSYSSLNREIWGSGHRSGTSISPVLRGLRAKLRHLGEPGEVLTVRGKGLRLVLAPGIRPLVAAHS